MQPRKLLTLIDVEYEVLPAVTTVEEAIADGAPQLHDDYKGNVASHSEMTTRRHREGLRRSRHRRREDVPHEDRPPGLHRAAHGNRLVADRRQNHHLVQFAGALPDKGPHFRSPRYSALPHQGRPNGDRRRIRREDDNLS